jgi:guanine deaminase
MSAMRQSVIVSRMREGSRIMDSTEGGCQDSGTCESLSVDWKEALYLATRGGALALKLPRGCGLFEVGSPFDVQHSWSSLSLWSFLHTKKMIVAVWVFDAETNLGVGALDFFDAVLSGKSPGLSPEIVEKWWSLGDVRNRAGVWVQGIKLTG